MIGYQRQDGRIGLRNVTLVVYLVECARHVAERIASPFDDDNDVHAVGFSGCYRNEYAFDMLRAVCTHPNVGAVLLCSLGCEGFDRSLLEDEVVASGRAATTIVIQNQGGTTASIAEGREWVATTRQHLSDQAPVPVAISDLTIATICGGSDSTSGITANPAVGVAFDRLVDLGASVIFEETGELIGCEPQLAERAASPEVAADLDRAMRKAVRHYDDLGQPSFAPGNAEGGLTTIEEKSLGAYAKSGSRPIVGVLTPTQQPTGSGVYLLDVVPDGPTRWGFANINDNAEAVELIACGAHIILFTTGRGSVVGSAVAPMIKICANPTTYDRLTEDMDINAGAILDGAATHESVADEILDSITAIASGTPSKSEALGHREFIMTYKSFDSIQPACHPS